MSISHKGYETKCLTFETGETITAGELVTVNSLGQAVKTSNGGNFVGVCIAVRNGYASVQVEGYVELPYSGSAPSVGLATLVSDSNANIKAGGENDVVYYKVLKRDTTNKIVGFIL
ncbi:MAG: hypothetical protein IJS03_02465 [Eubacterium sp.]|nr:hypothetical protein [Eubacterium sp.]